MLNLTEAAESNSSLFEMDEDEEHSKMTILILFIFYSLIFVIGITGNLLVVYVVVRKKSMRSVTNLFIMNLALSDILICLLAVPFTPISVLDHWVLGKFLCHLINFSMAVSVYVSTLTSLAIAIDRYFVIVHPFKARMKLSICMFLIGVIWIVSISISLPYAIYMELQPIDNVAGNSTSVDVKCQEAWPTPMSRRFFNLASIVFQYLIPFAVITYSYTKVWIILSNRKRPGKSKEKDQLELKRKKRTNLMLVAMVSIFAVCWIPLNSVHFLMEFNVTFTKNEYFSTAFFIAHVIAMSSTIYNPFLYTWLNENFRKEFRQVIPCIFALSAWTPDKRYNNYEEDSCRLTTRGLQTYGDMELVEVQNVNGTKSLIDKNNKDECSIKQNESIHDINSFRLLNSSPCIANIKNIDDDDSTIIQN